jgi:hypothetical protein
MYACACSFGMSRFSESREPEGRDAVDDPEVDHLRYRSLVLGQRDGILLEHLGGGRCVDVLSALERLAELRLARDVRKDAQLDLRVVGGEQAAARLGDERGADLAAELGSNRDRLQIGARRRQPPGRRHRLVDRRVQTPVVADQRGQWSEVRVHELGQLAPLLDDGDDLVVGPNRAKDLRVGRVPRLALASGRQLELLEQDAPELLRRAEHELLPGQVVRA